MITTRLLKEFDKAVGKIISHGEDRKGSIKDSDLKNRDYRKIAFIKLWAIGDAVNTLPMIRSVKDAYPKSIITVITKKSLVPVYRQDFIDKIITAESVLIFNIIRKHDRFDLVFDLEPHLNISAAIANYSGNICIGFASQPRSRVYHRAIQFSKDQHIVKTYMDMLRCIGINKRTDTLVGLRYNSHAKKYADKIMSDNGISKKDTVIGFCAGVGAMVKEREWGGENYKQLSKKILKHNNKTKIVLIGTKEDSAVNKYIKNNDQRIINLSGKMDLEGLFAFMKNIDIFVSNDTGPMHIAAAQGCRTIGLFGPNTPKIWGPFGKGNVSIFHPKKGCPFLDNTRHELVPKKLTREQQTCMDAIAVDEVYHAVKRMI